MEVIAFLIFSLIVGGVAVKLSADRSRVQIETSQQVLEYRLATRKLDDLREQRLLESHEDRS